MDYLCKNLRLTIVRLDHSTPEQIRITLSDDLSMTEAEVCCELSPSVTKVDKIYRQKEAITIGIRRLVSHAIELEMIQICGSLGESTRSNASPEIDLDLS